MQSHHIKPQMSIAVSKLPFDWPLVDSGKPVFNRAPPWGAHICPQLFLTTICWVQTYSFMSFHVHRVADPILPLCSYWPHCCLVRMERVPHPMSFSKWSKTSAPQGLRSSLFLGDGRSFFFFFFTPLGWVWQFHGCWAADRTLSAAVDGARTLPWPDPIIWVGSGKVESHCPSTMNQEYLHWASRSGNLMATTSHGH